MPDWEGCRKRSPVGFFYLFIARKVTRLAIVVELSLTGYPTPFLHVRRWNSGTFPNIPNNQIPHDAKHIYRLRWQTSDPTNTPTSRSNSSTNPSCTSSAASQVLQTHPMLVVNTKLTFKSHLPTHSHHPRWNSLQNYIIQTFRPLQERFVWIYWRMPGARF